MNEPDPLEEDHVTHAAYWFAVWCGITVGGALFWGFVFGPWFLIGLMFGALYAGACGGAAVFLTAATASPIGLLQSRTVAAFAGGLTGVLSQAMWSGGGLLSAGAGSCCAIGAALVAAYYPRFGAPRPKLTVAGMLIRTAYCAVLCAAWRICQTG